MGIFNIKWQKDLTTRTCTRRCGLVLLLMIVLQIFYFMFVFHGKYSFQTDKPFKRFSENQMFDRIAERQFVRLEPIQNVTIETNKTKPLILVWTPAWKEVKGLTQCMNECPVQCEMTTDRNQIKHADVVKFHLSHMWKNNWEIGTREMVDLPTYRRPDQIWAVYNWEPPCNLFGDLRVFNGLFNWTLWYRKDATVFYPYSSYINLTDSEKIENDKYLKRRNFYKEKTGEIVGMVSNCKDPEFRYLFIAELSKYLDTVMYGQCYNKVCGTPSQYKTCENITSMYKFFLALENSRCKDYVTEKYWQSLERGQIPIVNWDYSHINKTIPIPRSFISISDFENTKQLVDYIEKVSKDENLYNSYFEWRRHYRYIPKVCSSCVLCQALYRQRVAPQTVVNLDGWVQNDVCEKVNKKNHQANILRREMFLKLGI